MQTPGCSLRVAHRFLTMRSWASSNKNEKAKFFQSFKGRSKSPVVRGNCCSSTKLYADVPKFKQRHQQRFPYMCSFENCHRYEAQLRGESLSEDTHLEDISYIICFHFPKRYSFLSHTLNSFNKDDDTSLPTCCFPVSPYRPIDFRMSSTSLISGKHFIMNERADMSSSNISWRCCKRLFF